MNNEVDRPIHIDSPTEVSINQPGFYWVRIGQISIALEVDDRNLNLTAYHKDFESGDPIADDATMAIDIKNLHQWIEGSIFSNKS